MNNPTALAMGGLLCLAAVLGIGRFVFTPIVPLMMEDLAMSKSVAGLMASFNFAGYLIGALLASADLGFNPRRRWLLASLALSAITTAGMGCTTSSVLFFLLRFLGGVASAFVMVLGSTLVLNGLVSAGQPRLAALHFAGVGTGITASAIAVSILTALGGDWRSLWFASGLLALACLVAAAFLIPESHRDSQQPPSSTAGASGGFRKLLIAYGLFGFGYVVTSTFLVAIVRASEQAKSLEPFVWIAVGASAAPSILFWDLCARRIGIAQAFAAACVVEATGVVASVVWQSQIGMLAAAIFLGGTFMGLTALGLIESRRRAPADPRRALALMVAAFGFGQILGPAFAGAVYDSTGSFFIPSIAAASALVAAAFLVLPSR